MAPDELENEVAEPENTGSEQQTRIPTYVWENLESSFQNRVLNELVKIREALERLSPVPDDDSEGQ